MRAAPEKLFLAVILGIALGTLVLHIGGATDAMTYWWGAHFYSFFPPVVLFAAAFFLVAGCVLSIIWRQSAHPVARPPLTRGSGAVIAVVAAAAGGVVFWIARTRNTYLGDGNIVGQSLAQGSHLHPREPLTVLINEWLYRAATATGGAHAASPELLAEKAVAIGSVVAGVVFVAIAWFLAEEIARLAAGEDGAARSARGDTVLVWIILLGQGYAQLFFGYVENYTYYTVGIALYLWAALRYLRGAAPLALPAAALLLSLLLHVSGAVLAPSFAVLGVWGLVRRGARAKALRDLGIAAVLLIGARVLLAVAQPGYDLFATVTGGAGNLRNLGGTSMPGYLSSKKHLFDFANEHLLAGPLGLWLFLPALVLAAWSRRARSARAAFLAVAGAACLAVAWFAGDSNLGYARNWDLLAPTGLVFTAAGLGLLVAPGPRPRLVTSALACAVLVSLFHTVPWIATNASVDRSFARLKALPLGMGRTEVLASSWCRQHGQPEEAHRWLERAVAANPANNNAYYLLGADFFEAGDMTRAAAAFARASELRPDKVMFRQMLVMSLFGCGRGAEAVPHIEFMIKQNGATGANWALYGEALKAAGRTEEAQAAFHKAIPLVKEIWDENPDDMSSNISLAQLFYNTGDYEAALPYLQRAIGVRPNSDTALALSGYTLRRLGRIAESNDAFRRCLAINPNHPDHAEIQAFLSQ